MKLNSLMKDKKGMSINDLYPVVLIIAIIGILLGIVMTVMSEWQDVTNTESGNVIEETLTSVDYIGDTVTNATLCGFTNFVVGVATNATGGETIDPANYTVNSDEGIVTISTAGAADTYNASDFNVTYSYNYGAADCDAMQSVIDDFADFVPWIGIILLVIAAGIVLGVVISSFKKPRI